MNNIDNNENVAFELVKTEHVVQDHWIDFRRETYRMPNGVEAGPFYNYSRRSYVVIAASDEDGNYLCVRQFRHGLGCVTTEFPAGGIEISDEKEYAARGERRSSEEDALAAAKRELQEETGYISDEWTHLITVPSNATVSDNYAHLYLARNCRKVSDLSLDDTEFLNVEKHSPDEMEELIRTGNFQQAIHILAWELQKNR